MLLAGGAGCLVADEKLQVAGLLLPPKKAVMKEKWCCFNGWKLQPRGENERVQGREREREQPLVSFLAFVLT